MNYRCLVSFLFFTLCVCYVHVCADTCNCACACGDKRLILSVFLNCFPNYMLRQGFTLNLELRDWLQWLTRELQGSSLLFPPALGLQMWLATLSFTWSPHVCMASNFYQPSHLLSLPSPNNFLVEIIYNILCCCHIEYPTFNRKFQ